MSEREGKTKEKGKRSKLERRFESLRILIWQTLFLFRNQVSLFSFLPHHPFIHQHSPFSLSSHLSCFFSHPISLPPSLSLIPSLSLSLSLSLSHPISLYPPLSHCTHKRVGMSVFNFVSLYTHHTLPLRELYQKRMRERTRRESSFFLPTT